jgi:hypothetical protein
MARWTIQVDDQTDRAVRTHLARSGGQKGDLSQFVADAARRAIFWETVDEIHAHNDSVANGEIETAINSAVEQVRANRP